MLHASLETFTDMFLWPAITSAEVRSECYRAGVANFHATLPILGRQPFMIVVDHVFEQHAWFEACQDALKTRRTCWVGVRCSLEELKLRELARGDRRTGLARWRFMRVHEGKPYAVEVDTSRQTPKECAAAIFAFVASDKNEPRACRQKRGSAQAVKATNISVDRGGFKGCFLRLYESRILHQIREEASPCLPSGSP